MRRQAHLSKSNKGIIPAEIMGDANPGNQSQTDEYGGRTKDSPIDANEHRTEVPVADGGDYLGIVHGGESQKLSERASWERENRRIIASH